MKALVFTAPSTVELQDVADPEVGSGERLVHVRSAGICGSELHGVRHPGFRKPPLIMGHEFAGVTDGGEPVAINPILSCGQCDRCRGGLRHVCAKRRIIGVHLPGGFAERVAVPGSALRPLPPDLGWEAAALIEPAATALHAWDLASAATGLGPGARVAVIGCGSIGLLCILAAFAGGASVDAADVAPARLEVARRLGATTPPGGLDGEYEAVFDAVGSGATRALAVAHHRPGGVAVWLGLANGDPGFDATTVVREEKRITGSFAYSDDAFARAAGLLEGQELGWAASYRFDQAEDIFTRMMNGQQEPVKALITPAAHVGH